MRLVSGSVISAFLLTTLVQAQPQIGGGVCTNSTLSGIYYYFLSGDLLSGNAVYPYVELGKLVADGQGGVSGNSHASIGGSISAYALSGTYSVQSSCTGTMTLSVNSQPPSSPTFQVTNGGLSAVVAFSRTSGVVAGRAYRQTTSSGTIQYATASLSGSYAYLLTGVAFLSGNGYYYSQAGSATGAVTAQANMAQVAISAPTATAEIRKYPAGPAMEHAAAPTNCPTPIGIGPYFISESRRLFRKRCIRHCGFIRPSQTPWLDPGCKTGASAGNHKILGLPESSTYSVSRALLAR